MRCTVLTTSPFPPALSPDIPVFCLSSWSISFLPIPANFLRFSASLSLSFFLSSFSPSSARYSLLRASLFFTGRFWISTPVLIIRPANKHCRRHWSDTLSGPTMINGTIKFTWKYRRIRSRAYGVYNCYFIPVFFFRERSRRRLVSDARSLIFINRGDVPPVSRDTAEFLENIRDRWIG